MAEENAILVNAYKASGSGSGSAIEPYIIDYKTFGTDSYVYNNKDILHEVYERADYCMNDTKLRQECFDYLNSIDEAGHALAGAYGISDADTLESLGAMTAVAASSTAMTAVAASSTAMTAVINSSTALSAVVNSSTAINSIVKTSSSTTLPFWKKVNTSLTYVKSIFSTVTMDSSKFTKGSYYNVDNVASANSYGATSNTILLISTGQYDTSHTGTTNVFINGTKVINASALLNNSNGNETTAVTSSNIGAIGVPTTTFTENNDGNVNIQIYTAK